MGEYIAKDTTDYRAQASSIFSKVKTLFNGMTLNFQRVQALK